MTNLIRAVFYVHVQLNQLMSESTSDIIFLGHAFQSKGL